MTTIMKKYGVRIATGLVLLIGVFYAMALWMPVLNERRLVRELSAAGGNARLGYYGPKWLQSRFDIPWLRVYCVELSDRQSIDKQLLLASHFRHLNTIDVRDAKLSDKDWATIGGLPGIIRIDFQGNNVTDRDLERLKPLTSLAWVMLRDTRTTAEGRAELRKLLPNCRITPDP